MALSLAAAALGSAVIGGASSLYGASQQKKAANKALTAQQQAAQQQLAAQQANFDRIVGLNQPYIQGGQAAYNALLQQFGIAPMGAPAKTEGGPAGVSPLETSGRPALSTVAGAAPRYPGAPQVRPATPDTPDYKAYLAANPDVQANYEMQAASPEGQAYLQSIADLTPGGADEDLAAAHYQGYGKDEGRALPVTPGSPEQTIVPDFMNGTRPDAQAAPEFTRPAGLDAPDLGSFFTNFQADPGYGFRVQEALKGVNAASAVRGKLRSGDAAKALQDRANSLADQAYNTWVGQQLQKAQLAQNAYQFGQNRADTNFANDRAYGTSLWQNTRDFANNNFNTDRQYQTNRYDTNTSNIFNLANAGLTAAGNVAGAGTNFANAQSNIFGSQANAAADAAYQRASANAQLGGALAGTAGNLFANWGGGAPVSTSQNPFNQGFMPAPNANPAGFVPFQPPVF